MVVKRIIFFASLLLISSAINRQGKITSFDSAVEYLPNNLMLKWSFDEEKTSVTFEYWIPHYQYEFYGWAGFALQDPRDARDDFICDYYIAILHDDSEPALTDRYAETNGLAPLDTEQGCTNDVESWSQFYEEYLILYMTRPLINEDPCDIKIPYGKPVLLKWALGQLIEGQIQQHDLRDMGFEYFILADDYLDNNSDQRQVYGPWYTKHPQQIKWEDEFGSSESEDKEEKAAFLQMHFSV